MLKHLLLFIFTVIASTLSAQIGLRGFLLSPTGELGSVMNKKFSGELLYIYNSDDNVGFRFGISYADLKPRLDTFPVYAVMNDGTGTTVLPGFQTFEDYKLYLISGGLDYKLIKKKFYSLYPGFDFLLGGIDMTYRVYYENFIDESFSGGNVLLGARFRLGNSFKLSKNINLFFEASRNIYIVEETGILSHNEFGTGLSYTF